MEKVYNDQLKELYINKFKLNDIFTDEMSGYMELVLFKKGEYICNENEKMEYLFFLVNGKGKVYVILKNGKSLLLSFYYPLTVIGDIEIVNNCDTSSNIQALEDSYCIALPLNIVREKLLKDAKFLRYVCDSLGRKLQSSSNNNSINLLYPLENRLASYILAAKEEIIVDNKKAYIFNEKLTELAELLGTSYRHLLRTINALINKGVISKENGYYKILDKKLLKTLSVGVYK